MKRFFLTAVLLCATAAMFAAAKDYTVSSPDGRLTMTLSVGEGLSYTVKAGDRVLIAPSALAMTLADGTVLGRNPKVGGAKTAAKKETIQAPLYRQSAFESAYNGVTVRFKGDYGVEMRAYNDGVAYRFVTTAKGELTVTDETVQFNVEGDPQMTLPYYRMRSDKYYTSFESQYTIEKVSDFKAKHDGALSYLPVVLDYAEAGKVILMESDVESYPGLFINYNKERNGLVGELPGYPTDYRVGGNGDKVVSKRADYVAKVQGTRTYPWRIVGYAPTYKEVPVNNMVYALAAPCRLEDTSWIEPGHCAWEWWNHWDIWGVDFAVGINTPTYKYMIDFAADFGLQYVVVDAGWNDYYNTGSVMTMRGDFDVREICSYAKGKGVKVILWLCGDALDLEAEKACKFYSEVGVAGFKLDFHDRQDQNFMEETYRLAEVTAKYHLLLDFHGMPVPKGINRTYPNVINFEGVFGLENLKWTDKTEANMPRHDVLTVFLRQVAGPHDYTPGAMINMRKSDFRCMDGMPASQGTRAHQVAAYVCFDSPLNMLADSPTRYIREAETTRFISQIPSAFDRTFVLDTNYEKYVIMGRQKGEAFYLGAFNDWDARRVEVDFSFLPDGTYRAQIFRDGINANHVPMDYKIVEQDVTAKDKLTLDMAAGGGFAMVLKKK